MVKATPLTHVLFSGSTAYFDLVCILIYIWYIIYFETLGLWLITAYKLLFGYYVCVSFLEYLWNRLIMQPGDTLFMHAVHCLVVVRTEISSENWVFQ